MEKDSIIKAIGDYWDKQSSTFDKEHDTEDIPAWMNTLEALLGKDKRKNVLDLGTGTGFLANMTARLGYPTVGMDLSPEMMRYGVRHAAASGSGAMYMVGNALELPLMKNTVDNIVNARLIWTLISPDEMIAEWFRVLKPGGTLYCFNRMEDGVGLKSSSTTKPFMYDAADVDSGLVVKNASMQELTDLLLRNGFEDVEIRKLPGLTRPEFDYQTWHVLIGRKPVPKRYTEEVGIADFWDKAAAEYEAAHELADKSVWRKVLAALIGADKEQYILDVATGTGMIANMLGSHGYANVTGADISEGMMRIATGHAREQDTKVGFVYGNAMELPFAANTFDGIINSRLLWTLSEPENAIKEWYRVLKSGGKVIAINELEEEGIQCSSIENYQAKTQVSEFPFANASREQILEVFRKAGFNNVSVSPMPGCHMVTSDRENWYAFIGTK
jgi:ubiquinone/menaquinone biosynthesis C-methylase UbiE